MNRKSKTNWARVDRMKDKEIDLSEVPELGKDFFGRAVLWPGRKRQITLRIDPDVLKFFRRQGRGYQTVMNNVLRRYMEARSR